MESQISERRRGRRAAAGRRRACPLVLCLAVLLAWPLIATAEEAAEPTVDGLVSRVTEGLGGEDAWEAARYFVFEFAGRRAHWWDRYSGRHRLEGTTREEEEFVVLHDVDDEGKAGRVWLDGEEISGERAAELLENAYAAWVNDTFWLVAPYKLRDPGVELEVAGSEEVEGVTYDRLRMSFEGVGLTPGDVYWLFVHPETGLVDRWEYVLESQEPPPTAWDWLEWKEYGPGIMLSGRRVQVESEDRVLTLGPIAVPQVVPDSVFASPEPVGPIE